MEEQDKRTEGQEDVEAHGGKSGFKPLAAEDAPKDEGDEGDVEAHGPFKPLAAEDTPKDEGDTGDVEAHGPFKPLAAEDTPKDEGDDGDFELHRRGHRAL